MKCLASFDRELVAARWRAAYYETSCGLKCRLGISTTGTTVCRTPCDAPVLSAHQKYPTALAVAKDLTSLAAEQGMATFKERLAFLKEVGPRWAGGSSATIASTSDATMTLVDSGCNHDTR
ncbi:hypothetical protein LSAT2_032340 [Lamellibrachia satsuma]|nr:hypothetical protein LSAT2_032340 [Lamellibrachia satsuma]